MKFVVQNILWDRPAATANGYRRSKSKTPIEIEVDIPLKPTDTFIHRVKLEIAKRLQDQNPGSFVMGLHVTSIETGEFG